MNVIDIIIAALLIFGLVKGLIKGLVSEVASLVALVAGIYGSIHFSGFVKNFISPYINWDAKYIQLISFVITFLVIAISISLLGKLLTKAIKLIALGWVNKLLGAAFGIVKIALIICLVVMLFDRINGTIPFVPQAQINNSILYNPVKELGPKLFPKIINQFKKKNEKS